MQGVVLMAFGKPHYGALAFNMALSIKFHNPEVKIQLIYERPSISFLNEKKLGFFDILTELDPLDLYEGLPGKKQMNPGRMKTRIYKYLAFENNLWLDADGVALKDISPLVEKVSESGAYFLTQTAQETHTISQGKDFKASIWAWADDIWSHYNLPEDAVMPATNTSVAYIKKCDKGESFYAKVQENFDNGLPIAKLRNKWGGGFPDELAVNVACAQFKLNPSILPEPILFARDRIDITDVIERYYLIGLYGGVRYVHQSAVDYYDRLVQKYSRELLGVNQEFKYHMLVKHKHANKR